jgi:hypothetical protein
MEKKASELERAGEQIADEYGEWLTALGSMRYRVDVCASEEFRRAYEREVSKEYDALKREWVCIPVERTSTVQYTEWRHISEME